MCAFKKNLSKLVNFCAAILILKMEEDMQHFQLLMLYFKRGKNTTEMQKKKRFVQCMQQVLWLIECVKSGLWSFLVLLTSWPNNSLLWGCLMHGPLCIRCLAAALASTHWKPIAEDSRHSQNIQINKVTGENEKCIFYFMEKT